jgi:DNA-binding protein H-NS
METYKAVMAQIEKLKHKAEQIRQAEIKGVVDRIRDAMAHYGLTADDLRLSGKAASGKSAAKKAAKKAGKKQAKVAANPGAPKYRDPATGKTWTGRGKPPNWIVGVSDRTAFLIAGGSAAAKPAAKPAGKKTKAKSKAKRAASTLAAAEPTAQA